MSLSGERGRADWLAGALPERRALMMLVLAQQTTGFALGLIWLVWAPGSVSYLLDSGNGIGVVVPAQTETQIAGDGRYALLTALAGLVFGLLGWRLRASRGPMMLGVLAASSLLGSLLALAAGQLFGTGQHASGLNTAFRPSLVLHGTAEVFLQALFAVLVYTVFAGLSSDRELGRSQDRPPGDAVPPADAVPPGDYGAADLSRQPNGELRSGG